MTHRTLESETEFCDDGTFCSNGSKCVENTYDEGHYFCDCDASYMDPGFEGLSCEHFATTYCTIGNEKSRTTFCTNEGECVKEVSPTEEHMGCKCPPEYEGPYCQFVAGSMPDNWPNYEARASTQTMTNDSNNGGGGVGGGIIAGIVIVVVVAVLAAAIFVRRRVVNDRSGQDPAAAFSSSGEKDDDAYHSSSERISGRDLELEADGAILHNSITPFNGNSFPEEGAPSNGRKANDDEDGMII